MAVAAVPAYLGQDYRDASPGMRFGMYLKLWQPRPNGFERLNNAKQEAMAGAGKLTDRDRNGMQALLARQTAMAKRLQQAARLLRVEALSVAPFATGLGNETPLENGFAFLNPYGLPYLPGSGVKGVLRKAADELARGLFGGTEGWDQAAIDALFGVSDDEGGDLRRGALGFWDVIPQVEKGPLQVEIMTAHQSHYLQGSEVPHESGQPNPIPFLTVPPGAGFVFHIDCNLALLQGFAPELAANGRWQTLVQAALQHAFDWLGFGAKTAVGYGAMHEDPAAQRRREKQEEEQRQAREAEEQARRRESEMAQMSPARKAMAEYHDARPQNERDQNELTRCLKGLKNGELGGDLKLEIARELKAMMEECGKWKPTTKKKKPEKDTDYQNTLLIQRILEPS